MILPGGLDEGQTDETKVSIVADTEHGIDLLYSRRATAGDGKMVVRYARWESYQSLKSHNPAVVRSLSGNFDPWPNTNYFDYQMMCLAGCRLYAAYPTDEVQSGRWDEYVSVIQLDLNTEPCMPDAACYANCDGSTTSPRLNVLDFTCFLHSFADGQAQAPGAQIAWYANCDTSTNPPVLNVLDFSCFLQKYAAGCQ